ncbi:cyanophycinase [Christiangramia sediminis]|uniref:Cyanophycinase n=1 Tax=Christiangramia sediminis TaxID=2881336 RepID=A0A9X1LJE3_9FLAO|nr:cyanophycinase [Christiangramia sediminis]MCB7481481.1 cyanophycinase [Christiangramia sediminis]
MNTFFQKKILLIGLLVITLANGQNKNKSGTLFIIGGGSRPVEMVQRIIRESEIDKGGYGVILPMASSEPDSAIFYAKKQFTKLGMKNIVGFNFSKNEKIAPTRLDSLRNANLIYISGGDQDRFMQAIKNTPVEQAIHENYQNGGMIAGTSAGAAVMSKKMITGTELKHPEYHSTFLHLEKDNLELKEGLGLIKNVIIDQHFVRRSRYNRLLTAVIEFPEITGIGIDESTAILIRNNISEVVGESQVIVISNPDKPVNNSKEKLAAKNIKMSIYLNGDKFKM